MKDKIIQIAVTSGGENNAVDTLFVLTEKGDLYTLCINCGVQEIKADHWQPVPLPHECVDWP